MMRTGEQRRDQRLLWVGVGVAVVVVGLFAFLTGLYSNGTATPSTAFYAPFFRLAFHGSVGSSRSSSSSGQSAGSSDLGAGVGLPAKVRVVEVRRSISDTQREVRQGRDNEGAVRPDDARPRGARLMRGGSFENSPKCSKEDSSEPASECVGRRRDPMAMHLQLFVRASSGTR